MSLFCVELSEIILNTQLVACSVPTLEVLGTVTSRVALCLLYLSFLFLLGLLPPRLQNSVVLSF